MNLRATAAVRERDDEAGEYVVTDCAQPMITKHYDYCGAHRKRELPAH